jgi:hypothetical protein
MRQSRSSGSVEGVMGNHDSYSDFASVPGLAVRRRSISLFACVFVSVALPRRLFGAGRAF